MIFLIPAPPVLGPDPRAVAAWRARQWSPYRHPIVSWPPSRRPPEVLDRAAPKRSYRVLVPAVDCAEIEHQHAAGAAQLAPKVLAAGGVVRCTYALAEDVSDGTGGLVASCCVRVRVPGRGAGFASWHNGHFTSAVWLARAGALGAIRRVNAGEFAALVAGEPLPERRPAEVGQCPRACGRSVRFTTAGAPYAHTRPETKERCE